MVLGVPFATLLGQNLAWREAYGVLAVAGLISSGALLRFLPTLAPSEAPTQDYLDSIGDTRTTPNCCVSAATGTPWWYTSMDRLTRNLDDLRALVQSRTRKGVRVEFDKESLVFTGEDSPIANLMLSVMGAFTEFGRSLIRERQREGMRWRSSAVRTRDERRPLHRKRAAELVRRAGSGVPTVALARDYRTSRKTVYQYLPRQVTSAHRSGRCAGRISCG
ncbi:DNA-binding CsgD family transcriptional regulator [Arthrobacter sp. OAP107]